jgi:glutamate 5-kinase
MGNTQKQSISIDGEPQTSLDDRERRVVVKVGTSSLVTAGRIDRAKLDGLCRAVADGVALGLSPVLVTSGAIALGRARHRSALGSATPAADQVAATVGQNLLYSSLQDAFARCGLATGQILLTPHDLVETRPDHGVLHTFDEMRQLGFVPVVNENDALGVRNNDVLAALVSAFLGAGLLLLLTDVDGFYDSDPKSSGGTSRRIDTVSSISALEAMAGPATSDGGTGGMAVKICACRIATQAGVRTVVASAAHPEVLIAAFRGERVGTQFSPRPRVQPFPELGQLWRSFRTSPLGSVACRPDGLRAVQLREPLRRGHVAASRGRFRVGDVVDITDPDSGVVARGSIRLDGPFTDLDCAADTVVFHSSDYTRIAEDEPCQ